MFYSMFLLFICLVVSENLYNFALQNLKYK